MPTNRMRIARGRISAGGIPEAAYEFFSFGPFFDGEAWAAGQTEEELHDFWKRHRSAIMQRFLEELRQKGPGFEARRPEYFWRELTEPRLVTGKREFYRPWPDKELHTTDVLETDFQILKRLNLLEPWELKSDGGGK